MTNSYCKEHEEIEPEDNEGIWMCSECSKKSEVNDYNKIEEVIREIEK